MNICFVNSTKKWGGVKTWTVDLAQELVTRGHQVHVISRAGTFADKARARGCSVHTTGFGPDYNPVLIARMCAYFRIFQMDLVVVNVGKDLRTGGIAARLCGIPVVHRVGLAGDMLPSLKVHWTHLLVRPALLVPCLQIKQGLLHTLPHLRVEEITVIPTGKRVAPTPPDMPRRPIQLVSTSQLNPDKEHRTILNALALLRDQGHDFHYHVAGQGKLDAELRAQATRLELAERVTWHGFTTDVRTLLAKADIFILASRSEGLPNALLEAMAEGLVCVARDVGGVAECWPENEDGLLPYHATEYDFSMALNALMTLPPHELQARKHRFWRHAMDNSLERMTDAVEAYFSYLRGEIHAR